MKKIYLNLGKNELEKAASTLLYKLILAQFDVALVKILLMAALASFALEESIKGVNIIVFRNKIQCHGGISLLDFR